MLNLKKGDYVRIKDGTHIEGLGPSKNWGGKLVSINQNAQLCELKLDAQTLDQLPDGYFLDAEEQGLDYLYYFFEAADVIPANRRDTDAQYLNATKRIDELTMSEEEEDFEAISRKVMSYVEDYRTSEDFENADDEKKEEAIWNAEVFTRFALNYLGEKPDHWTPNSVREVCLYYVPGKLSAPAENFVDFGENVARYFLFLQKIGALKKAEAIAATAREIASEIPKRAADPRNWHMAKSMIMPAIEQDIDLSDQNGLDAYLAQQQQQQSLSEVISNVESLSPQPRRTSPKIGRNDKVSVKYVDGAVKKDIKYKKVMRDLKAGKCELL